MVSLFDDDWAPRIKGDMVISHVGLDGDKASTVDRKELDRFVFVVSCVG